MEKSGKSCSFLTSKEISMELEHVKAHRTEKDKKETTQFVKFVTDGNE